MTKRSPKTPARFTTDLGQVKKAKAKLGKKAKAKLGKNAKLGKQSFRKLSELSLTAHEKRFLKKEQILELTTPRPKAPKYMTYDYRAGVAVALLRESLAQQAGSAPHERQSGQGNGMPWAQDGMRPVMRKYGIHSDTLASKLWKAIKTESETDPAVCCGNWQSSGYAAREGIKYSEAHHGVESGDKMYRDLFDPNGEPALIDQETQETARVKDVTVHDDEGGYQKGGSKSSLTEGEWTFFIDYKHAYEGDFTDGATYYRLSGSVRAFILTKLSNDVYGEKGSNKFRSVLKTLWLSSTYAKTCGGVGSNANATAIGKVKGLVLVRRHA